MPLLAYPSHTYHPSSYHHHHPGFDDCWSIPYHPYLLLQHDVSIVRVLQIITYRGCKMTFSSSSSITPRLLLVIAHPDDEAMFFSPLLLSYHSKKSIFILCLSNGNYEGHGEIRTQEVLWSMNLLILPYFKSLFPFSLLIYTSSTIVVVFMVCLLVM